MQERSTDTKIPCQHVLNHDYIGIIRPHRTHQFPVRLRVLASAEVGQGPGCVPDHGDLVVLVEEGKERAQCLLLEDVVSALWRVTGDVAERPDGLLTDIEDGRREELDEDGHGPGLDDDLGVVRGAGGDVCQSPCCLELCDARAQT